MSTVLLIVLTMHFISRLWRNPHLIAGIHVYLWGIICYLVRLATSLKKPELVGTSLIISEERLQLHACLMLVLMSNSSCIILHEHSSAVGVRSYKRITDSLREKTSAVLNASAPPTKKEKLDSEPREASAVVKK